MSTRSRALATPKQELDWQQRGVCRGSEYLFDGGVEHGERHRREVEARGLCARCPVQAPCAAYALRLREPSGVWGGFTAAERRRLLELGWEDVADRRQGLVDVAALKQRLLHPHRTEPDLDECEGVAV